MRIFSSYFRSPLVFLLLFSSSASLAFVSEPMPTFTTRVLNGETITLAPSKIEKPTLIVFWATWCDVCIREMPAVKRFYNAHRKDIDVIGISIDDDLETPRKLAKEMELEFLNVLDAKGEISEAFKVTSTPAMYAVDKKGQIVKKGHRVKEFTSLLEELALAKTASLK